MTQSKVEEIIQAMSLAEIDGPNDGMRLERMARAAIAPLREPTEKMVRAAYDADGTSMPLAISYEEAYTAMIDAALEE